VGSPPTIICDQGHTEGRRLRDYSGFGDPLSDQNALLIECGQHWERSSVAVAKDSTARFLMVSGALVEERDVPADWLSQKAPPKPRLIRVTDAITAASMDLRFAGAYTGLEVSPKAGAVIGWSNGVP
jgi:hypothetical protein